VHTCYYENFSKFPSKRKTKTKYFFYGSVDWLVGFSYAYEDGDNIYLKPCLAGRTKLIVISQQKTTKCSPPLETDRESLARQKDFLSFTLAMQFSSVLNGMIFCVDTTISSSVCMLYIMLHRVTH